MPTLRSFSRRAARMGAAISIQPVEAGAVLEGADASEGRGAHLRRYGARHSFRWLIALTPCNCRISGGRFTDDDRSPPHFRHPADTRGWAARGPTFRPPRNPDARVQGTT